MSIKTRWLEFFEGENNLLSMHRLLAFAAYPPATGVLIWIHTTEALGTYLGAFVLNGVANKWLDVRGRMKPPKKERQHVSDNS